MVRVIDQNDQFPSHSVSIIGNDFTSALSTVNNPSSQTFICIITDLTDASNTSKRHVINLSGSYTIEHLIREAADFYSYDPFTFNLFWKSSLNHEMINLTEFQESSMSLSDLGMTSKKNTFEIHEKNDGPPKRIEKENKFLNENEFNGGYKNNLSNDNLYMMEPINYTGYIDSALASGIYPPNRRNAEIGPANISQMGLSLPTSYKDYFDDDDTGYVGLINQAMTCYLNSLLQTLFMTPEFRNAIYRWNLQSSENSKNDEDDGKNIKNIPLQLQRLFLNLQTSNKKSIQTHDLTKSFGWNSEDAFQQHDVQELSRVMFDALEQMFKGTKQENLINELYQGKVKDYVKCLECETESAKVDVYLDVPLCIRPFGSNKTFESVEEALDAFVEPEILDENNKYLCSKCNRMCKAHKGLKFESFPYILSLQLKRFDFDYNTMSRFKLNNSVTFPEVLNVKKYLDIQNEQTTSSVSDDNQNTSEMITDQISNLKEELDKNMYDYELFSIMIHSGSATGGHYYAYIKDFEKDQWYNFNDEKVTKLDRQDIYKAFGTSYSMYSSATAYMLLYRQKNSVRNEKFIKVDEFNEEIKLTLEKFKKQQIEADILKEYMENVCKVKVIVDSDDIIGPENFKKSKRIEKILNIHKDMSLNKAKLEVAKEFNLLDQLLDETNNKKCRLLKYDTYNDLIEQSYKNETEITVFEAVGFTKFPYNFCWYLEIIPENEKFIEYNSNEYKVKIISLNLKTLELNELFYIRLKDDARVSCLQNQISQKLGLDCEPESIRMALEKNSALYNYLYLNESMDCLLKSLNFQRVCKVFIEIEEKPSENLQFSDSKFFNALDAISNIVQTTVYLPNDEQCGLFKLKTKRRFDYLELQNQLAKKSKILGQLKNENSEIQNIDFENIGETNSEIRTLKSDLESDSTMNLDSELTDTSSKMSFRSEDIRKLDQTNYDELDTNTQNQNFKTNDLKNEMETNSLEDEGIGSSKTSSRTKSRSNSLETIKANKMVNVNYLVNDKVNNIYAKQGYSGENVNLEDFTDDEDDNETHLGDVVDRCDVDLEDLDSDWKDTENMYNENNSENEGNNNLDLINPRSLLMDANFKNDYTSIYLENVAEKPFIETENNDSGDVKMPESLNIFSDDSKLNYFNIDKNRTNIITEKRFIESSLNINEDLGTRILEIRMDKRIDLKEFKSHINKYLKMNDDDFRVFRICQNDLECELTSHENQFTYLTQNTKFLIKLGPPLKYGEYVLPVYKINNVKGSISYLCDFMIIHGLSVLNHKELLKDDIKEECDLEISVDRIRLRKKISKRPGAILINKQFFGKDIFVNSTSELCIEILEDDEKKTDSNLQASVYLRHWQSDKYELGDLCEIIVNGLSFDVLVEQISSFSGIAIDDVEVLKCKRDYPFKSPILEIHNDPQWISINSNFYLQMEKLEDGICFYYRNRNLELGTLSEEKRRDMVKTDNINFRPVSNYVSRKEKGVRIQVESN